MSGAPEPVPGELPPAALAALARGNKIEAIRIVREAYGLDLKDSKDLVDAYEDAHPVTRSAGPREDRGLLRVALILALIVAVLAVYGWFTGGAPR